MHIRLACRLQVSRGGGRSRGLGGLCLQCTFSVKCTRGLPLKSLWSARFVGQTGLFNVRLTVDSNQGVKWNPSCKRLTHSLSLHGVKDGPSEHAGGVGASCATERSNSSVLVLPCRPPGVQLQGGLQLQGPQRAHGVHQGAAARAGG